MRIGVPKEIKIREYRAGLVPSAAAMLVAEGHEIYVETGAGAGIGFGDDAYRGAGATIVDTAGQVFDRAELIVKVKEPQAPEYALLREDHTLFTYLHLAADKALTSALMASGATCVAYETVTGADGGLPLLRPMSEVAGRMSAQVGARFLEKEAGGAGILMGGVPGVVPASVVVLGGGVAGSNAAFVARGMGANVTIFDISPRRLAELDQQFLGAVRTVYSATSDVERAVTEADVVIGAVLIPGASAPKLVSAALLPRMRPGSVLVDVAIDQGGCFETSRPTTHDEPTFTIDGVIHYCVANMPGAVPRTSAVALNNATLPYIRRIADRGVHHAMEADTHLAEGLNISGGRLRHRAVAAALDLPCAPIA
jgi:alanine dehydrogenase